jgi:hypothetical protein
MADRPADGASTVTPATRSADEGGGGVGGGGGLLGALAQVSVRTHTNTYPRPMYTRASARLLACVQAGTHDGRGHA